MFLQPSGTSPLWRSRSAYIFVALCKGVFKGGGFRGFKPPPPKFSDFFLKSEGKEIERKRKKRDVGGGGGYLLTYFGG